MNASSPPERPRRRTAASTIDKPIRYIVQNLERAYGVPVNRRRSDPLDVLIAVILSQATSDINSDRTFAALRARFPTFSGRSFGKR
jgi:endonuclease III